MKNGWYIYTEGGVTLGEEISSLDRATFVAKLHQNFYKVTVLFVLYCEDFPRECMEFREGDQHLSAYAA